MTKKNLPHTKINKQRAKLAFKAIGCYTQVDSFLNLFMLPACAYPPPWIYSTILRPWQLPTRNQIAAWHQPPSADRERGRATHNIHWSDGLQRHRQWFQAVCTNVTSVCCQLQPNLRVCIIRSGTVKTTFLSMLFLLSSIVFKETNLTPRWKVAISIRFPGSARLRSLWWVKERALPIYFTRRSKNTKKLCEFKAWWRLLTGSPNQDQVIRFNRRLSAT